MKFIPYCTGHYSLDACKEEAKRLRASGKYRKVKIGHYITDMDGKWARVLVSIDTITLLCKGCSEYFEVDVDTPDVESIDYCTAACAKRTRKRTLEGEYQHRDNMSIFDVEGV